MLQEIAAFGNLVLVSLKSLHLMRNNRLIIAKALGVLYRELTAVVANGDKILRILRSHNGGKDIDLDTLGQLLEDQHVIIRRINTALGQAKVKTALSIHAPHLSPLPVILEDKRLRIELLRKHIEPLRRRFDIVPPTWLGAKGRRWPLPSIEFPDDCSIDHSRQEL